MVVLGPTVASRNALSSAGREGEKRFEKTVKYEYGPRGSFSASVLMIPVLSPHDRSTRPFHRSPFTVITSSVDREHASVNRSRLKPKAERVVSES